MLKILLEWHKKAGCESRHFAELYEESQMSLHLADA